MLSKDVDIEIFHLDADTLMRALREFGRVDGGGVSLGVIKLWAAAEEFDFHYPAAKARPAEVTADFWSESITH